ncbi:MAG: DUF2764 family protein [Bacteroidota bacterium]
MSYYYLISGLPDLKFNEGNRKLDFNEIFDTIQRNLDTEDELLSRYLFYPNDNTNLLDAIFQKHKEISIYPFKEPTFCDKETISNFSRNKGFLPEYMGDFLSRWEEHFPSLLMWEIEEKLLEAFYAKIETLDNGFLKDYFLFERSLKKVMAVFNKSYFGEEMLDLPADHQSLAHQVGKGKTPSASLVNSYPYVEKLNELFPRQQVEVIEQIMDQIRWDYLSNVPGHFEREVVLAYCLKLFLVKKWTERDAVSDNQHFIELIQKIKSDVSTLNTQAV